MNHDPHATILFDGVCNFCNSRINFIIRHDDRDYFRFAPLQSEIAEQLLKNYHRFEADPDTFILIENGKCYDRTSAALRIAKKLNGLWPLFYVFILVPPFLRDIVYRIISKNRYKWWGKRESCMIPTPEMRKKFIS